jgi:hypothetical protein
MSTNAPSDPPRPAPAFRRESLPWLALLLILSLGLYMLWWMYRQTQVINAHSPNDAIPSWLVHLTMISVPASMMLRFSYGMELPPEPPLALVFSNLVALSSLVMWLLRVRRGINALSGAALGDATWISLPITLLLTLFQLSPVYMQFVINRVLEQRGRA